MRNIFAIIALFQSFTVVYAWTQGRRASRLPLAIIFRAFGAPHTDFRLGQGQYHLAVAGGYEVESLDLLMFF